MNKIKQIILDQTNWLEVTWVNIKNITLPQEEITEGVADMVLRTQEVETVIHCESFGDIDEYTELLKQRCTEFGVELTEEHLNLLAEQKANRHTPTEEELAEIGRLVEEQRIAGIKAEAGAIIKSRYSIEWQLNHPRLDATYSEQYAWIDRIREISNEAEANRIQLEDIVWG